MSINNIKEGRYPVSIQTVREYFKQFGIEDRILEFDVSSATVELAAGAVGVEGARICKTLSFRDGDSGCILIQTAGDAKIDNRKFKISSGRKPECFLRKKSSNLPAMRWEESALLA